MSIEVRTLFEFTQNSGPSVIKVKTQEMHMWKTWISRAFCLSTDLICGLF